MTFTFSWFVISLMASIVITAAVVVFSMKHRTAPGGNSFVLTMFTICLWQIFSLLFAFINDPQLKLLIFNVRFFFVSCGPIFFLATILQYLGKARWLTTKYYLFLFSILVLTQIMTWTNSSHHLFVDMQTGTTGPYFWVHMSHSFILMVFSISLIFQSAINSHHVYRKQAILLLIGSIIPVSVSFIEAYRFFAPGGESYIPVSFSISGILLAWALFKYGLFDLVPIARTALIEMMRDGIVVVDSGNKIADINRAAEVILKEKFGWSGSHFIGESLFSVIKENKEIINAIGEESESRVEIAVKNSFGTHSYDLNISTLSGRDRDQRGKLIIWRNITRIKEIEIEKALLATKLDSALDDVKNLSDLLPICASCKNIRDDEGYWHQVESYFQKHSDIDFSHGICPDCSKKLYPGFKSNK